MRQRALLVSTVVLIALALSGFERPARGVHAQDATPEGGAAMSCPTTTPEENKELARRFWAEVWTAGGEAAVAELLAPDELHHWGLGLGIDTTGTAAFIERRLAFLAAFPDFRIAVDQVLAEGDFVVTRWTATGTHEGSFAGIAPTGRSATWTGIQVFRVACGQIAESWGVGDHLGLRRQLGALPAAAAAPSVPASGATPAASPAAGCPATTADENEALARRWYEAINSANLDLLDDLLDVDASLHSPVFGVAAGREAVKRNLGFLRSGFPDVQNTVEEAIAEGDLVALRWSAVGTHQGEFQGIAPTGRQATWTGINLFRISCGRIIEVWAEVDSLGWLQQLGGVPGTPTP